MKLRDFFHRKSVRYSLAGFASSFIAYGAWYVGTPVVKEYQSSFAAREFKQLGVYGTYKKHFFSFVDKIDGIQGLDQENQALSRQVATLEKQIEVGRSESTEIAAKEITEEASHRLQKEAGSDLARELKSIEYRPPNNLLPHQLYSLAVGYFRKQEYEQAAVILSQLITLKEDSSYQKAETQMMCAIAWYKLKHYKLSGEYVKNVKAKSVPADSIYRTALVWEALTAKAEGNKQEANLLVTAIISRYPHSEEAAWVNSHISGGTARVPASGREKECMVLDRKLDSEVHKNTHVEDEKHDDVHHEEKHESKDSHPSEESEHHEH